MEYDGSGEDSDESAYLRRDAARVLTRPVLYIQQWVLYRNSDHRTTNEYMQLNYLEHDSARGNSQSREHHVIYRRNDSCVESVKCLVEKENQKKEKTNPV